ncbi:Aldehyde/histidinol dehydrogenase [Rhodocollybia butyracea]|uniref:Aldehyde/histidinol dehydrogenase n=1 Tax=Rhodocollybia butyracea TaxID=206335 RepID=A0A9P5U265_9AGAR|nr:Aldehyde/histidinol dehydrogenase [Rhodocollybia butyracea]
MGKDVERIERNEVKKSEAGCTNETMDAITRAAIETRSALQNKRSVLTLFYNCLKDTSISPIHLDYNEENRFGIPNSSERTKDSKQSKEKDRKRRYSDNVDLIDRYNADALEVLCAARSGRENSLNSHLAIPHAHDYAKYLCTRTTKLIPSLSLAAKAEGEHSFEHFRLKHVEELYSEQPSKNSTAWNRIEFRPLEGFVFAVTPFNFTAIGGNLCTTPALVGNNIVWKPSPAATYSNYIIHQIFIEAGMPPGVIQSVPGPPEVVSQAVGHKSYAALQFTGSTFIFSRSCGKTLRRIWTSCLRGF